MHSLSLSVFILFLNACFQACLCLSPSNCSWLCIVKYSEAPSLFVVSLSRLCPPSCFPRTCRCVYTHKQSLSQHHWCHCCHALALSPTAWTVDRGHSGQFGFGHFGHERDLWGYKDNRSARQRLRSWFGEEDLNTYMWSWFLLSNEATKGFVDKTHPALIDICSTQYV